MIFGLHQFDMHFRHVAHARHVVIEKVRLLHRAVGDADAFDQRQPQAVDNGAFGLRDHVIGMHRHAAVDHAPEVMHLDCAGLFVHRHIRDARHMRAGVIDVGQPQTVARTLALPLGHFRGLFDHVPRARLLLEHAQTKIQRINACFRRELVDEHFGRKTVGGQADAAQRVGTHAGMHQHAFAQTISDFIGADVDPAQRDAITPLDLVVTHGVHERHHMIAHAAMVPARHIARRVQPRAQAVHIQRTETPGMNIVLARPDHFYRPPTAGGLGQQHRIKHEIGIAVAAPPEAAAEQAVIKFHFGFGNAQRLRRHRHRDGLTLHATPDFHRVAGG